MTFDANQLDERLAPLAETYRETKVREPGELPPDGDYQARVDSFDFFESKDETRLFMKTVLVVVAGDEARAELTTIHQLNDPDRLEFLKRHLTILGVEDPDEIRGLRPRLAAVVGRIVEARVATSNKTDASGNPYRNVYVNKVISAGSDIPVDTSDFKPATYADDDIPF